MNLIISSKTLKGLEAMQQWIKEPETLATRGMAIKIYKMCEEPLTLKVHIGRLSILAGVLKKISGLEANILNLFYENNLKPQGLTFDDVDVKVEI